MWRNAVVPRRSTKDFSVVCERHSHAEVIPVTLLGIDPVETRVRTSSCKVCLDGTAGGGRSICLCSSFSCETSLSCSSRIFASWVDPAPNSLHRPWIQVLSWLSWLLVATLSFTPYNSSNE